MIQINRKKSNESLGDFPGDPVKTSPSNAGVAGGSLVSKLRSHMPHNQKKRKHPKHKIEAILLQVQLRL